jgi:hypothetical protein
MIPSSMCLLFIHIENIGQLSIVLLVRHIVDDSFINVPSIYPH